MGLQLLTIILSMLVAFIFLSSVQTLADCVQNTYKSTYNSYKSSHMCDRMANKIVIL